MVRFSMKGNDVMKKRTCFLLTFLFFLMGIVAGILLAPAKNGFNIGNNSGNQYYGSDDDDLDDDDCTCC